MSAGAIKSVVNKANRDAQGGIYTQTNIGGTASGGNMTSAFPRKGFGRAEPDRDELVRMKQQMMDDKGMTKFGEVYATDADFEWLKRKRETEAAADFDNWVGNNFHTNDAVTRKWLQETYPEYYESREREMTDRAKFALRLALLKLRGPKNEKDLILMWGLQTGAIQLDRDWNVIGASDDAPDQATEQARFKRGLMAPPQFLGDAERKKNFSDTTNPFKPRGAGAEGAAQGQVPYPFYGGAVAHGKQYPDFLKQALQPNF